jgi:hypothetical protein
MEQTQYCQETTIRRGGVELLRILMHNQGSTSSTRSRAGSKGLPAGLQLHVVQASNR